MVKMLLLVDSCNWLTNPMNKRSLVDVGYLVIASVIEASILYPSEES